MVRVQIDLDGLGWKELKDEILVPPHANELFDPIPEDVQKALAELGIRVEAPKLPEAEELVLRPSELVDSTELVKRPMYTYVVHGAGNQLLLQALRLQANVATRVERARQWLRSYKAAQEDGGVNLTHAQVSEKGRGVLVRRLSLRRG